MRGRLSEQPVPDVCRELSGDGVTGALEVSGTPGVGRVFFRAGSVYWAMSPAPRAQLGARLVNAGFVSREQLDATLHEQSESDRRTKLGALLVEKGLVTHDVIRVFVQEQILDALFDLMRWQEGDYVFHPGDAVDEKLPIDVPVAQLLVEASRRQNEWDQIQRVITSLEAVPDHVVGGNAATAALEQDEFTMLASIDGRRSVRELASDLGYSEFEAARIVYGLTLLGIVEVDTDVEPADEAAERPGPATASPPPAAATTPTHDEDVLDVGATLEQALFGRGDAIQPEEPVEPEPEPVEPAAEEPDGDLQVTVHFDLDQQHRPTPRTAPRTDAPAPIPDDWLDDTEPARPAAQERPATPPSAWASGDDEGPEPWVMSYGQDETEAGVEPPEPEPPWRPEPAEVEPEPFEPDALAELASITDQLDELDHLPEPDVAPEAGPEPERPRASSAELAAQFADLSAAPEPEPEPEPEEAEEPSGAPPEPEEPAAGDDDGFFAGRPSEPAEPEPEPDRRRSGDVSEFLRELSQLSLDEEESGDDEDNGPSRSSRPSDSGDQGGDDRKKRGRFGRGR